MLTCRTCKKKYRSKSAGCPDCKKKAQRQKSGTARKIRVKNKAAQGRPSPRKNPATRKNKRSRFFDNFVDLFEGDSKETREVSRLLKKEGIPCRIEQRETLKFQYRLHETRHIGMHDGRVAKVPASLLGKAKALLNWEFQDKKRKLSEEEVPTIRNERTAFCPACDAEVDFEDSQCPDCGLDLDEEALEADEEEYFCFSCGEACSPEEPVCPICGAHFDH
ncbi:MAG TPA: zinc ribbon domain-containing protein [Nitrospiria bacterium]